MSDPRPDIVERLRMLATVRDDLLGTYGARGVMAAAADEIERLRAEIEDMKNALWKACGDDEDAVAAYLGGVS